MKPRLVMITVAVAVVLALAGVANYWQFLSHAHQRPLVTGTIGALTPAAGIAFAAGV